MWVVPVVLSSLFFVGFFIHAFVQWRARDDEERRVMQTGEPAEATVIDQVEVELAFEGAS